MSFLKNFLIIFLIEKLKIFGFLKKKKLKNILVNLNFLKNCKQYKKILKFKKKIV